MMIFMYAALTPPPVIKVIPPPSFVFQFLPSCVGAGGGVSGGR